MLGLVTLLPTLLLTPTLFLINFLENSFLIPFSLLVPIGGALFIIWIVLYINLTIQFFFAKYIFVNENLGIIDSLKKSKTYITHHGVRILMHIVSFSVTVWIISLIPLAGNLLGLFLFAPLRILYFYKLYLNMRLLTSSDKVE